MGHTKDVVRGHKTRAVEEEKMEKGVAHILPGQSARSLWVFGELLSYKIPSQQTGGAYALFEVATAPRVGPPPHVQHREDETFWVLEGEYEFLVGGDTLRAKAGSLLYVPKGTLHAHENVGEGVGRMLLTQTPGGLYERFFEEVGEEAPSNVVMASLEGGSPEAAMIAEVAARYGIEIALPAGRCARTIFPAEPGH